jgi:hypothetical protein
VKKMRRAAFLLAGTVIALSSLAGCARLDSLSWSPDGEKMAFEGSVAYNRFDIWVVDVSGEGKSTPRQLTHTPDLW